MSDPEVGQSVSEAMGFSGKYIGNAQNAAAFSAQVPGLRSESGLSMSFNNLGAPKAAPAVAPSVNYTTAPAPSL